MTSGRFVYACMGLFAILGGACSSGGASLATEAGTGGTVGGSGSGGRSGSGGHTGLGGSLGTGGSVGSGGATHEGGAPGSGGATTSPTTATDAGTDRATGGMVGRDAGRELSPGTGGANKDGGPGPAATGGIASAGGVAGGAGGGSTGGTGGSTDIDCNAAMPSGGQQHSGNSQGGSGNLAWQIWSNQGTGTLTTFSTPAFSAAWNNSGDYLGRLGFEWGNGGKTYDSYGTITAQFASKKTGSGGSFSYIGIYGWSTNPCVEWYIVDDSFNTMPFTPWNSSAKGSATIDGETYKIYSNSTNGTGGSRCNASSWMQFWSIRQKARQCGTMTISDHFKAWDAAGMKLGNLLEAKILVETGGGSGSVNFPVAILSSGK